MEIDKSLLELSQSGYEQFQDSFRQLYEAFTEKSEPIKIQQHASEKGHPLGWYSYQTQKRIVANLNLHGFVKVYKKKPAKPSDWKPGDRIYSYLEVHATDKGFKAFKKGAFCPVPTTTIHISYEPEETAQTAAKIGIGKGYLGHDGLLEKYFASAKDRYAVAMTRFYEWTQEFDQLFKVKLVMLKEQEAAEEIEKLIQRLVPTLPVRRNVARIREELKQTAKLEAF